MGTKKPITIRGITYKSYAEAARDLGLARNTISNAVRKGYVDQVGQMGKGGRKNGLSVTIDGETYQSVSEAARQTGVSYWNLRMMAYDQKEAA